MEDSRFDAHFAMIEAVTSPWTRGLHRPGGGDAALFYVVFGQFPGASSITIDRERYRTRGADDLRIFDRSREGRYIEAFHSGALGKLLEQWEPSLGAAIRSAPQCCVLRAQVADPPTLEYLRDAVGVVTALLDAGGVGVFDLHALAFFSPADWRARIFDPDGPVPTHHVQIIESRDEGGLWLHTRGLRKFGRPDLSVNDVPDEHHEAVIELLNRFIDLQGSGALLDEGTPIKGPGLPPGMTCHHGGTMDDPDFNNVHVEVRWPRGGERAPAGTPILPGTDRP
jgi:hypothetical protein